MILKSSNTRQLRTIVVDLTPVLPGGENGGAKVFVLELLRRLAERTPQTQFVLLTQASAHEELAALDSTNVRRLMVLDPSSSAGFRDRSRTRIFSRILAHLPGRLSAGSPSGWDIPLLTSSETQPAPGRCSGISMPICCFVRLRRPPISSIDIPTVCIIYDLQYKTYPEFFAPEDVAHRSRTFKEAVRRSTALAAISDYSRDCRDRRRQGSIPPPSKPFICISRSTAYAMRRGISRS